MLTVVVGLVSAFSYSLHDLLMVRVTRASRPLTGVFWVLVVSLLIMAPLAVAIDGLPAGAPAWRALMWAALGGVFYLVGLFCLLRGFSVGALSLVTPLAALEGAFAAVYSLLAGEQLTSLTAVALPLAVAGAVLASIVRTPLQEHGAPASTARTRMPAAAGAGWGLLAGAVFAVTLLMYAETGAVGPVTAAATGRAVSLLLAAPVVLLAGAVRLARPLRVRTAVAGAFEAAGYVASVAALARGPVSVASVMVAQFAFFAVILGIVVLRERPAPHQLAGIACTIAAVTLFGASS